MDVIGQTFGYVVEFFLHTHKKTSVTRTKCTRKTVCRYTFVTLVIIGVVAYTISVALRCAASYETPSYQDKVSTEKTLEFPSLYVCSKELISHFHNKTKMNPSLVQDSVCAISSDWNFDPTSLIGKNATKCSIGHTDHPPIAKLGRNWSCTVFNLEGHLNATRDRKEMESMHVAFKGSFTKPLTAIIIDKEFKNNHVSEPSFIFSAHTDVYVLMRKIQSALPGYDFIGAQKKGSTEYVSYLPTISSTTRFDSTGKRDAFTHLSLSFSSFDVTTLEQAVTFSWLDALAAIGGATCAARIFLLILPDAERERISSSSSSSRSEEKEEDEVVSSSSNDVRSLQSPLLVRRVIKSGEINNI
jgi:hypothetical protein